MSASNIGPITHVENLNHFSMEQAVKLFEELLKIEREMYNKEKEENKWNGVAYDFVQIENYGIEIP